MSSLTVLGITKLPPHVNLSPPVEPDTKKPPKGSSGIKDANLDGDTVYDKVWASQKEIYNLGWSQECKINYLLSSNKCLFTLLKDTYQMDSFDECSKCYNWNGIIYYD